jgi:hypothetical protein
MLCPSWGESKAKKFAAVAAIGCDWLRDGRFTHGKSGQNAQVGYAAATRGEPKFVKSPPFNLCPSNPTNFGDSDEISNFPGAYKTDTLIRKFGS